MQKTYGFKQSSLKKRDAECGKFLRKIFFQNFKKKKRKENLRKCGQFLFFIYFN